VAGFAVGGPQGMQPKNASALLARLKQSAPPQNPSTPGVRSNLDQQRLHLFAKVNWCCDRLLETMTPDDQVLGSLIDGVKSVMVRLAHGDDPQMVVSSVAQQFGAGHAPPAQPPGGAPPQAPLPSGMGLTAGGPPQGGPPVSPGVSPGQ
jgi:hypothetical protein